MSEHDLGQPRQVPLANTDPRRFTSVWSVLGFSAAVVGVVVFVCAPLSAEEHVVYLAGGALVIIGLIVGLAARAFGQVVGALNETIREHNRLVRDYDRLKRSLGTEAKRAIDAWSGAEDKPGT